MKSPIYRDYEERLISINNQFCYFLFTDQEVEAHLLKKIQGAESEFVGDTFPGNEHSKRINVKNITLPKHREDAFNTLAGVSLMASVEYLLSYIKDVQKFRAQVSPSEFDSIANEKPESQLYEKLQQWNQGQSAKFLVETIRYLRLRRNHFAHQREQIGQELTSLLKYESKGLNTFWGEKETKLHDFDFTLTNVSEFNEKQAIALINLTWVCMKLVDEEILKSISEQEIFQYEIHEFLRTSVNIGAITDKKASNKFSGYLESKYGARFTITESDFVAVKNA